MSDDRQAGTEYRQITEDALHSLRPFGWGYYAGLALTVLMMCAGAAAWSYQIVVGMGASGLDYPMMWGIYIINYVWWIAIAMSGTATSAILFLFRPRFRTALSRTAEAMAVIAIPTAGLFPVMHLGRTWRAYWLFPYPNERGLWTNFTSPLILDVWTITAYFVVSVLFFWVGLLPDLAVVRDRSRGWARTLYGLAAAGWEGRGSQWKHYLMCYAILAGLAAPLVVTVHSVVSWDFALGILPGWHETIYPPYFVAGAIFSGLSMLLSLLIPMRYFLRLERHISINDLEAIAVLVLLTSLVLTYSYANEYFTIWYSRDPSEGVNLTNKAVGDFAPLFWILTTCNSFIPLALFWRRVRRNLSALFAISILANIGMWLEREIIVPGSLARGDVPYSWAQHSYTFAWVDVGVTVGAMGVFLFIFLLFVKFLPVVPMAELKADELTERRIAEALRRAEAGEG